jgi:hypothetical protein
MALPIDGRAGRCWDAGMNEEITALTERTERLQATVHLLAAEVSALTYLLRVAQNRLAEVSPGWSATSPPGPQDLKAGQVYEDEFARLRRQHVQQQLLVLSKAEEGLASRLMEMLERSCTNLPVNYRDEDVP